MNTYLILGLDGVKIRSPDHIKRRMKKDLTKQYHVCKNGCYLYADGDLLDKCPNPACEEPRYRADSTSVPQQEMACVSIGAALAELLYDDDTRDLFLYKSECDSHIGDNRRSMTYTDIFSGKSYQNLFESGVISSNDICLIMYADGFQHKFKANHSFTMIHSIIMNMDPSMRYNY